MTQLVTWLVIVTLIMPPSWVWGAASAGPATGRLTAHETDTGAAIDAERGAEQPALAVVPLAATLFSSPLPPPVAPEPQERPARTPRAGEVRAVIAREGGRVTSPNRVVRLEFPARAVPRAAEVRLTTSVPPTATRAAQTRSVGGI